MRLSVFWYNNIMNDNTKKDEEYDRIQEDLIQEDQEKEKEEMPVSGKSVFDLKRLKEKKSEDSKE